MDDDQSVIKIDLRYIEMRNRKKDRRIPDGERQRESESWVSKWRRRGGGGGGGYQVAAAGLSIGPPVRVLVETWDKLYHFIK